jgi:DNA helicase IV
MGFLSRLFSKNRKRELSGFVSSEGTLLLELRSLTDKILSEKKYIARSDYAEILPVYKKTADFFGVLIDSGTVDAYAKRNGLSSKIIKDTVDRYNSFDSLVDTHNKEFIKQSLVSEKSYLDSVLRRISPEIILDEDQRKVVLSDEDYTLVIAGAGAGKTTTIAAKVKYLVEKQKISPKEILVVSFTNKAVGELKDKLNSALKIDCPIATFHSVGNAILRKRTPEKLNIVESSKLYFVIQDYFRNSVLKDESTVNNLIMFFATYFDAPYEGNDLNSFFNNIAKANYSTIRSDLNEFERRIVDTRTRKAVTIQNEVLRSYQEVEIANFLYLNNIDYEYEPIYRYDILFARKPYTPDFIIRQGDKVAYIEHFGITQNGKNDRYSDDELTTYKKAINDKISLHRRHGSTLIYTFSAYNDNRPLVDHLKEELETKGFALSPRSNREVLEKLVTSEENRYIRKLVSLICRFITNFKTNGFTADEFSRMYHSTTNVRSRLFLNICNACYLEYDRYLKTHNAVDFEDMINESARVLHNVKEMSKILDFKYIIVDEYQDISRQRFDLVSALHDVTKAKIVAVGDDWQSIYAFSGSDISLFTGFQEKMGYAKLLKIVKTYRNSQEVIDIAGNFIQKNRSQIQKELVSPSHIDDPVIIYTYDGKLKRQGQDRRSGANYALASAVETALTQIIEYNKVEEKTGTSILLLGRYGFDGDNLERSGLFEFNSYSNKLRSVKYPKLDITFMTAHASKGLGYDNVIIVNGKNETFGFPSKIEDDPVLSFVIKGDRSIDYAEERRLFYVAMTRTKNRIYVVAPEQNPSEFLIEIKRDYKNVVLKGEWNEEPPQNTSNRKTCPVCGYPMQFRYKNAYGLRLFMCTNEPEICGFMTNEYKAGKLCIMKCDKCRDGYMIVKPAKNGDYFLGCTNYKADKTGCGNIIWKQTYYEQQGYEPDTVKRPELSLSLQKTDEPKSAEHESPPVDALPENIAKPRLENCPLYKGHDLNETVWTVLNCLNHISADYFYGVTMLTDILRGTTSDRIVKFGLDKTDEYAALSDLDRDDITSIIYWLIAGHYILRTREKYPTLHPTYEGTHYSQYITAEQLKKLYAHLTK